MKEIVDTTEMYLRTILELEEEGITPLRARIVERLGQSGPTVSQTVARMERDGLVNVLADRSLDMTEEGHRRAVAVMRKHRLAERLLTDVLKMDIALVDREACRWEHVMSDEVERRIIDILPDARTSPFGNPIPGLEELGLPKEEEDKDARRMIDLTHRKDHEVEILRLNEIIQADEKTFHRLQNAGIFPGSHAVVHRERETITISTPNGSSVQLPQEYGHAIVVKLL